MTFFNHVLAGASIAVVVRDPLLAAPLALASHFALDMMPHFWHDTFKPWTKSFVSYLFIDTILSIAALALSLALFPQLGLVILLCTGLATLPDWLWAAHYGKGVQHKFFDFHHKIQRYEKPWGAFIEAPFTAVLVVLLWSLA
ncbi:MAG: hypothetical protein ACREGJ_02210 [Candidatus Saccharimonadales bacterium]